VRDREGGVMTFFYFFVFPSSFSRLAFFAVKEILEPGVELCTDYGKQFWSVKMAAGELYCECGQPKCITNNHQMRCLWPEDTEKKLPPLQPKDEPTKQVKDWLRGGFEPHPCAYKAPTGEGCDIEAIPVPLVPRARGTRPVTLCYKHRPHAGGTENHFVRCEHVFKVTSNAGRVQSGDRCYGPALKGFRSPHKCRLHRTTCSESLDAQLREKDDSSDEDQCTSRFSTKVRGMAEESTLGETDDDEGSVDEEVVGPNMEEDNGGDVDARVTAGELDDMEEDGESDIIIIL